MPQTFTVGSRSVFVSLIAWAFIAGAALAAVFALVQDAASLQGRFEPLPALTAFLLGYVRWVAGATGALSLALAACALGLMARREWARRAAIGLLGIVIAAGVAGLWLQHELVQALVRTTLSRSLLPAPAADLFGGFATATQVLALLITLLACGWLGWVIRRLMSETVRQEFA